MWDKVFRFMKDDQEVCKRAEKISALFESEVKDIE